MKRFRTHERMSVLAVAALSVCGTSAEAVSVNAFDTARTNVVIETTLDHATLGGSATLVKDGLGKLNVNLSKVTGAAGSTILVGNGSMAVTLDGAGTDRSTEIGLMPPSSVASKLGLWLDASLYESKPELFIGTIEKGHAYVSRWLDVRETSPSAPSMKYAEANFGTSWQSEQTEFVRFNGRTPAIWFGGYGSGRCMNVVQGGTETSVTDVMHVFAVHIIDDSFGFIFGNNMHIGGWGSKAATLSSSWWYSEGGGMLQMYTGSFYVNGALVDGQIAHPETGLQMMEYDFGTRKGMSIRELFRDGNNFSEATGFRAGGGYLCEVMLFTAQLTYDERKAVSGYLARKWGIPGSGVVKIAAASGASLSVSAVGDALQEVGFSGSGSITKTGAETLCLRSDASTFAGQIRLAEGNVRLASPVPIDVRAGDRVTASSTATWPEVAVVPESTADAQIVKEGNETVHLTSLPAAVTRLAINGGAVHLDAPNANVVQTAGEYPEVVIANASFEDWGGNDGEWGRWLSSAGVDGWFSRGAACQIDYDDWTGAGLGGATREAWLFNGRPQHGKRSVLLYDTNDDLYTPVTIPVDGDYELSFEMSGRQQFNYMIGLLDVSLTASDSTTPAYDFGRVVYCWESGYERMSLRARGVRAGSYRLYCKVARTGGPLLLDNFRLHRVCSLDVDAWRVPNGDFERADFTEFGQVSSMSAVPADGWSFIQPDGYTGSLLLVGLTTFYQRWDNGEYFLANTPNDASRVQLYFRCGDYRNGRAEATFMPPAGTWYVRADAGRYKANKASLQATVKIADGDVRDLGIRTIVAHKMTQHYWPKSFTVDGTQSVTLGLVFSGCDNGGTTIEPGCMVDNVVLCRRNPDELLVNGSFEENVADYGWTHDATTSAEKRWAPSYYGTDDTDRPPECGTVKMTIVNNGIVTQPIAFGDNGWHELSWWAHRRSPDGPEQAVRAWIAWTDNVGKARTNILGSAVSPSAAFTRQAFRFRPPSVGTYTFGLEGVNSTGTTDPAAMSLVDCVSVKSVATDDVDGFALNPDLQIRVAKGARLHLGYQGTNAVRHVWLGGRGRSGFVSAETDPDYITGPGVLQSEKLGCAIVIR